MKILIIIPLCLCLSGCLWLHGDKRPWIALGLGKQTVKYQEDGETIKEITTETKSILEGIIGLNLFGKE